MPSWIALQMPSWVTLQTIAFGISLAGWVVTLLRWRQISGQRKFSGEWRFDIRWDETWHERLIGSQEPGELQSVGAVHLSYKGEYKQYFGLGSWQLKLRGQPQANVCTELSNLVIKFTPTGYRAETCTIATLFRRHQASEFDPDPYNYEMRFTKSSRSTLAGEMRHSNTRVGAFNATRR